MNHKHMYYIATARCFIFLPSVLFVCNTGAQLHLLQPFVDATHSWLHVHMVEYKQSEEHLNNVIPHGMTCLPMQLEVDHC
jgi:hypothetical protein